MPWWRKQALFRYPYRDGDPSVCTLLFDTAEDQWAQDRCSNCGIDHTGESCALDEHGQVIKDDEE